MAPTTEQKFLVGYVFPSDSPALIKEVDKKTDNPWNTDDLYNLLLSRDIEGRSISENQHFLGYIVFSRKKTSYQILRLVVGKDARRRGVGTALIECLQRRLSLVLRRKIVVDVEDNMKETHLFLKKLGFRAKKVIHTTEGDVYRFIYRVKETS